MSTPRERHLKYREGDMSRVMSILENICLFTVFLEHGKF